MFVFIFQVPGIEDINIYIQIPPGTGSHKLRLIGKGIKRLNQTGRAD